MSQEDMESQVYSVRTTEDDHKLHELTVRMRDLSNKVLFGYAGNNAVVIVDNAKLLADSVEEFLKVSGWTRP